MEKYYMINAINSSGEKPWSCSPDGHYYTLEEARQAVNKMKENYGAIAYLIQEFCDNNYIIVEADFLIDNFCGTFNDHAVSTMHIRATDIKDRMTNLINSITIITRFIRSMEKIKDTFDDRQKEYLNDAINERNKMTESIYELLNQSLALIKEKKS